MSVAEITDLAAPPEPASASASVSVPGPVQPAAQTSVTDEGHPLSADAGHANALAIAELCQLAGHPEFTATFLAEGGSEQHVRKALLLARADSPEIQSTLTPSTGDGSLTQTANPLLAAVKKLTGKE